MQAYTTIPRSELAVASRNQCYSGLQYTAHEEKPCCSTGIQWICLHKQYDRCILYRTTIGLYRDFLSASHYGELADKRFRQGRGILGFLRHGGVQFFLLCRLRLVCTVARLIHVLSASHGHRYGYVNAHGNSGLRCAPAQCTDVPVKYR